MVVLITGPVRSGKSARAAHVACGLGKPITYVATARVDPTDAEMVDRVVRHQEDRGAMPFVELWQTDAADLPAVISAAAPQTTLLVDSIGTWVAGHLLGFEEAVERDPIGARALIEKRTDPLIDQIRTAKSHLVLVAEETGWGLVPPSPLGRLFRDVLGRLCQKIAVQADRVELVVAGYALDLSRYGMPILS